MSRIRLCSFIVAVLACASGCDDKTDCDSSRDQAYCDAEGIRHYCELGVWIAENCADKACIYEAGKAVCAKTKAQPAGCGDPGTRFCLSENVVRTCQTDGSWRLEACSRGLSCDNGWCVRSSEGVPTGIVRQQCGADGKSVESVWEDGRVTSQLCSEIVGFETACESYSYGHVGCALPESCNDVFSADGTCSGDILMGCNTALYTPMPFERSCAATGRVCQKVAGLADCYKECDEVGTIACTEDSGVEYATKCAVSDDGAVNVTKQAVSLCMNSETEVSCKYGEVVEKVCPTGTQCLEKLGYCAEPCTSGESDSLKCGEDGLLYQCQAVGDDFAFISVGRYHCVNADISVTCAEDEELGGFNVIESDCRHCVYNGTPMECSCISDYQFPDMDVCIPVAVGDPCNGETNNGHCEEDGTLMYCIEEDDVLVRNDCNQDPDGMTVCSEYKGYAACRRPCTTEGRATCSLGDDGYYWLNLCAPDDKNGALSMIEGESICLGDSLYTCNESGEAVSTNCAANGGSCHVNDCVYPACALELAPMCTVDDAVISCVLDEYGNMVGTSIQTIACDSHGKCIRCENGTPLAQ